MKSRAVIILIVLILFLSSLMGCAGTQIEESRLFVQVGTEGSLLKTGDEEDTYLLTLRGVSQSTIWFTDRPDRTAGHFRTGLFIENWAVGDDSFADNPPNAALEIMDGTDEADLLVIELFDPEYDAMNDKLSYKVKVLRDAEGGLESFSTRADHAAAIPEHFGRAAIFIDSRGFGPGISVFSLPNVSRAHWAGADLSGTKWHYGTVSESNLTGADLTNADLSRSVLIDDILTNANLTGANLANTVLNNVLSGGIIGTPSALPDHFVLRNGYLVGPGASLKGANLSGINLADATLRGVSSGGIVGTPSALPDHFVLRNGYLVGPGANLVGAVLTGVDLENANLTGANLAHANLTNANLENANLAGVDLYGANLVSATLSGVSSGRITRGPYSLSSSWTFRSGYLMGPGANLVEAPLTGADLRSVNLAGANLENAKLANADLGNANLSSANLENVNLTGASLYHTSLQNANLTGANLTGASRFGADFSGVTWVDGRKCGASSIGECR
jgi:uncharacterized protein YjbI with pentapeptide repeats